MKLMRFNAKGTRPEEIITELNRDDYDWNRERVIQFFTLVNKVYEPEDVEKELLVQFRIFVVDGELFFKAMSDLTKK